MLDAKDQSAVDRAVAALRGAHGDAVRAIALIGEAASAAYRPRRSPLELIAVLDRVSPDALRRTRDALPGRRRLPPPLLMDAAYIQSSLDVFPLEFLEIGDRHRLLFGDDDPFAALPIHAPHLRLQVEEQLRGKMLHLWEAYLSTRSKAMLRRLLLETPPAFGVALRGLLRLADPEAPRPDAPEELLRAIEARFEIELPVFRQLEAARRGEKPSSAELEALFDAYAEEVRSLVQLTDRL